MKTFSNFLETKIYHNLFILNRCDQRLTTLLLRPGSVSMIEYLKQEEMLCKFMWYPKPKPTYAEMGFGDSAAKQCP